jgi:acetyl-CoA acetyltransferase
VPGTTCRPGHTIYFHLVSGGPLLVGAAETSYTRRPRSETTPALLAEAARGALDDARLKPADVDGLGVASFSLAPDHAIDLAWRLGLRVRWLMEDPHGGASALNMLQHACRAIEAGDAETILLLAGDAVSPADFRRLADDHNSATRDHLAPIPAGGPNALFALVTSRHMREHGLGRETYGRVVLAQRGWAALNPAAVYREPLTMADYLNAPIVAAPLSLLDCVPIVAGANALMVTTAERSAGKPAVEPVAFAASFNHDHQAGDGLQTGLAETASGLWEEAGLGPDDVDVASVYDDYPVMVLVQLSDLGFAADGDLERFAREQLEGRRLAVNTSGGQLSAGQAGAAGGMHGLVEAVRQLRGEAGERQVEDARTAVVTGYGMIAYRYGACSNAAVLRTAA